MIEIEEKEEFVQTVEKPLSLSKRGLGRSPKAGRRDASPRIPPPGTDAGRVCQKALHDAEPTKHTQPFTGGKGFGHRDNKSEVYFKNRLFLQAELLSPALQTVITKFCKTKRQ